jgi:hypothetical protein
MSLWNRLSNVLGDIVIGPWGSVTVSLIVSASAMAAVFVLLFQLVGRQQQVRRARNRLLARTLELLLFGHDARTLMVATGSILAANALYLWQFFVPVLVTSIPVTLLLIQGAAWFEHRPYRVGEPIVLEVNLAPGRAVLETPVGLDLADDLLLAAGPVRSPARREPCYRLVATHPGNGWVDLVVDNQTIRKQVIVGDQFHRLSTQRVAENSWEAWVHPGEAALSAGCPIERVGTQYPSRTSFWGLWGCNPGLIALVLSLILSLVFGRVCGVNVM